MNQARLMQIAGWLATVLFIAMSMTGETSHPFTADWQQSLALVLIILGMSHGATDFAVARRMLTRLPQQARYLLAYVACTLLLLGLLVTLPTLTLLGLLFVAAWHFGEHYVRRRGSMRDAWHVLSIGMIPLVFAAFGHRDVVQALLSPLIGHAAPPLVQAVQVLGLVVCAGIADWLLQDLPHAQYSEAQRGTHRDRLEVLVSIALFLLLPPLIAFAVYFCAIHAPRHMRSLSLAQQNSWALLLESLLLTLLALLLAWPLLQHVQDASHAPQLLAALLCLAAPHALNARLIRWAQQ
jgi:beta-carotene 15,15'-dioxygenase